MCPKKWDCRLVTPFWCTWDKVAKHATLPEPPPDIMVPQLGAGACNNDHLFVYTSVCVDDNGSALHLAGLDVYIRRQIGDWDALLQKARAITPFSFISTLLTAISTLLNCHFDAA